MIHKHHQVYSYSVKALKFVIMSVPKMITKPHKEKKNEQLLMQQAKQKDTVASN